MAARRNPDLVGDVIALASVGGLGLLMLSIASKAHVQLPGVPQPTGGVSTPPGSGPNSGPDQFNFNSQDSVATYHENSGAIDGHAGFGHTGGGGQFTLVIEVRDAGLVGSGLAGGDFHKVWETTVTTSADNDWTGYGVDFTGVGNLSRGLFHGVQVRMSIARGGTTFTEITVTPGMTF